jgi:hypothetical protein
MTAIERIGKLWSGTTIRRIDSDLQNSYNGLRESHITLLDAHNNLRKTFTELVGMHNKLGDLVNNDMIPSYNQLSEKYDKLCRALGVGEDAGLDMLSKKIETLKATPNIIEIHDSIITRSFGEKEVT